LINSPDSYVAADVAADGMMVWMANKESTKRRGKIQSLIYIVRSVGRIFMSLVIIFAFSGPDVRKQFIPFLLTKHLILRLS